MDKEKAKLALKHLIDRYDNNKLTFTMLGEASTS